MKFKRNAFTYFSLVIIVMGLGLGSRHFSDNLPNWINLYLGDVLWALMVFFLFGLIFRGINTRWITILAFSFSYVIEISQLYHSPWIDTLRHTRLGGLVLGYGFLWSDLVSYGVGIGIGILIERAIISHSKHNTMSRIVEGARNKDGC